MPPTDIESITNIADVGLIGLGVMGRNLALNIADHGFAVAVYNRTVATTHEFVDAEANATPGELIATETLEELKAAVQAPRRIIIMVPAGKPTDAVIDQLLEILDENDVVVDGGNAHWEDTAKRNARCKAKNVLYVGSGVSGGEEGARFGPSLMPGGEKKAYETIEPVWTAIAAKVDKDTGKPIEGAAPGKPVESANAEACSTYIGPDGAGHFVKMVHNGIEYADMQLIAEACVLMREALGMEPAQMADVFAQWNDGDLDSFLIEITADILRQKDPRSDKPFVDVVLDAAGQKGTGKWTGQIALELGISAPSIAEAVFARCISAIKEDRVRASKVLAGPQKQDALCPDQWLSKVRDALYCSKVCAYAQGFALMSEADRVNNWNIDFGSLAKIWRGGCIIRARFLQKITNAYATNTKLSHLLIDPYFADQIAQRQSAWRDVVSQAAMRGVAIPAFASSLAYFDSYRSERTSAYIIQAQRDYFGSHTYERVDEPRGSFFHLDWLDPMRPEAKA